MDKTPDDRPSLERIMEKLSYLDNRIEEHFGGLKSDISILSHELKEEMEGVKSTLGCIDYVSYKGGGGGAEDFRGGSQIFRAKKGGI